MPQTTWYWFSPKRCGGGWGAPIAGQGWVVLVGFMRAVPIGIIRLGPHRVVRCLLWVVAMSLLLVPVCHLTGEPPRGRWGGRPPS